MPTIEYGSVLAMRCVGINDNYTIAETETGSGQVGTGVTAVSKTYAGFTFDEDNANNVKTGNIQGIPVIDHLIVGDNSFYSFYENKKLNV